METTIIGLYRLQGFRDWGSGLGVWGLGLGVWDFKF